MNTKNGGKIIMLISEFKKEIENVKGAQIKIQNSIDTEDDRFSEIYKNIMKVVEIDICNYDDFVSTMPDCIKSKLNLEKIRENILSDNNNTPYHIGFGMKLFEDEIELERFGDVYEWVRELGCSEDNLRNAIDAVGNKVEDVRA